jgi:hypothetical protein
MKTLGIAASLVLAAAGITGTGIHSTPVLSQTAKTPVYIVACPGGGSGNQVKPRVKPELIVLACADYGILVRQAKWSHWGEATTTTTSSQLWMNDCTPDCADGTFHGEAAKATVTRIVKRHGVRYYTRIRVVPSAPNPLRYPTITEDFPS